MAAAELVQLADPFDRSREAVAQDHRREHLPPGLRRPLARGRHGPAASLAPTGAPRRSRRSSARSAPSAPGRWAPGTRA
jgi:hypothetical protein